MLVAVICIWHAQDVLAADACNKLLPIPLQTSLAKFFPAFHLPIADNKLNGRTCPDIAHGDFNGDGRQDFLLNLKTRRGDDALVVIALTHGKGWQFKTLGEFPGEHARLYVQTGKPGIYRRTKALDSPLQSGEMRTMKCPYPAAIFGTPESSGVAYCHIHQNWKHVWISD